MTAEMDALDHVIQRIYDVFANYRLTPAEPCEKCKAIRSGGNLRELTPEQLESYARAACTTCGDVSDFKHVLPRLLELLPTAPGGIWPEVPVLLRKLVYADWRHWPMQEQAAIADYLVALWEWHLGEPGTKLEPSELICGIAQLVDDLSPFLTKWQHPHRMTGYLQLARFIKNESPHIVQKRSLYTFFWEDDSPAESEFHHDRTAQMRQVVDWLLDPDTLSAMESAYLEHPSDPRAGDLAEAADSLRWLRQAWG